MFYEDPSLLEKPDCQNMKAVLQKCIRNPERFSCVPVRIETVKEARNAYDRLSVGFIGKLMETADYSSSAFPYLSPFSKDETATKPRLLVFKKKFYDMKGHQQCGLFLWDSLTLIEAVVGYQMRHQTKFLSPGTVIEISKYGVTERETNAETSTTIIYLTGFDIVEVTCLPNDVTSGECVFDEQEICVGFSALPSVKTDFGSTQRTSTKEKLKTRQKKVKKQKLREEKMEKRRKKMMEKKKTPVFSTCHGSSDDSSTDPSSSDSSSSDDDDEDDVEGACPECERDPCMIITFPASDQDISELENYTMHAPENGVRSNTWCRHVLYYFYGQNRVHAQNLKFPDMTLPTLSIESIVSASLFNGSDPPEDVVFGLSCITLPKSYFFPTSLARKRLSIFALDSLDLSPASIRTCIALSLPNLLFAFTVWSLAIVTKGLRGL